MNLFSRLEKAVASNKGMRLTPSEAFKIQNEIKYAFYRGMNYGYGVDHENIHEDEDGFWNEFKKSNYLGE